MLQNPNKLKYIIGFIVIVGLIYIWKLFQIQVVDKSFQNSADNNSRRYVPQYPARGLIYDRNGKLLVYNRAAYNLVVIPRHLRAFDTLRLIDILDISKEQLVTNLDKAKKYSTYKPSVILKEIADTTFAQLQEIMFRYPGFYVETRSLRRYNEKIAAHVLGYVGEVSDAVVKSDPYYNMGDHTGINGIEKTYEEELRGKKGVKIYLVDVHNRIKGSYEEGAFDTAAVSGLNLTTTIDADLQKYGEQLMQNKRGSIVAIEPSTGEILALVSSPGYDPNLLVGRARSDNYKKLANDDLKPLFNRAVMAQYPPGSIFKVINAMIGLQEGVITLNSKFSCQGGYRVGSFTVGCHHYGMIDFDYSIQGSCNAYYCNVYRRILDDKKFEQIGDAYTNWRNYVVSFGLGEKLGTDLAQELSGIVPQQEHFHKYYGKNKWKSLMLVSMGIGQGELGFTPMQMANMTAAIANRGYYITPHAVKSVQNRPEIDDDFIKKHNIAIDSSYFEAVIKGMELVVQPGGTAWRAAIPGIAVCGKTGTAENPHGEDHSIFVAFAPKDNPQIAISVYVENSGFGSTWAAPISSMMIEKYLTDSISNKYRENYIINTNLLNVE